MCGIAGAFNLRLEVVQKMTEHQGSRGPDFFDIDAYGERMEVIFGHSRLSIVDKSENSNQPISAGGLHLVYNGETYNYDPKLYASDTQMILSTLKWVTNDEVLTKFCNSLNGMFAFAFYDEFTGNITLVRDRFGIKPLYYTIQKDYFAFASTPAAVQMTKTGWKESEKGLQEYLSLGATMLHSLFEGIEAVPPGHFLTYSVKTQTVKITRWYYPKFHEKAIETIEERVTQAIDRVKLTCDERQIVLLSGGIDSTLVASRYRSLSAIHLRSPEQEYAEAVAKKFDLDLSIVDPEACSAEEGLMDYVTKSGDPTMAGLIPWITCREIKKLGYRVAITANGADELFFGYDRMSGPSEDQRRHIMRDFSFTQEINGAIEQIFLTSEERGLETSRPKPFHRLEIGAYLTHDLNKTLDFASMCHSVEVRVPYLDHELVEAAISLPQNVHIGKYGNKTILKKMLLGLGFDFDFIHRPKVGFSLHYSPSDWNPLQDRAMKWYEKSGYEQLSPKATARQKNYHSATVAGLYIWNKIYS